MTFLRVRRSQVTRFPFDSEEPIYDPPRVGSGRYLATRLGALPVCKYSAIVRAVQENVAPRIFLPQEQDASPSRQRILNLSDVRTWTAACAR
jgi:hypothetical protein